MQQIQISVQNKIASIVNTEDYIVCGNNDYEVVFSFDREWEKMTVKTALFVYGDKTVPVIFEGNVCKGVSISNASICAIGVLSGNLKTTTPALVRCFASISDIGNMPEAPRDDVYNQIIDLINKYINASNLPKGGIKGQVLKKASDSDYDFIWESDIYRDLTPYYTKEETDNVVSSMKESLIGDAPVDLRTLGDLVDTIDGVASRLYDTEISLDGTDSHVMELESRFLPVEKQSYYEVYFSLLEISYQNKTIYIPDGVKGARLYISHYGDCDLYSIISVRHGRNLRSYRVSNEVEGSRFGTYSANLSSGDWFEFSVGGDYNEYGMLVITIDLVYDEYYGGSSAVVHAKYFR